MTRKWVNTISNSLGPRMEYSHISWIQWIETFGAWIPISQKFMKSANQLPIKHLPSSRSKFSWITHSNKISMYELPISIPVEMALFILVKLGIISSFKLNMLSISMSTLISSYLVLTRERINLCFPYYLLEMKKKLITTM